MDDFLSLFMDIDIDILNLNDWMFMDEWNLKNVTYGQHTAGRWKIPNAV